MGFKISAAIARPASSPPGFWPLDRRGWLTINPRQSESYPVAMGREERAQYSSAGAAGLQFGWNVVCYQQVELPGQCG